MFKHKINYSFKLFIFVGQTIIGKQSKLDQLIFLILNSEKITAKLLIIIRKQFNSNKICYHFSISVEQYANTHHKKFQTN